MRNELDISLEKRYVKEEAFKEGREAGLAEGEAKGREEGLAEGRVENAREIALKMQSEGMDSEMILRLTGVKL